MKLLLVVDIGNTQMVFGLFRAASLVGEWRISSSRHLTPDELTWQMQGMFTQLDLPPLAVQGVMAASVVPHLDQILSDACQRLCRRVPAFVGNPEVKTGMALDYKNPREVGADRIANAVAARQRFGAPSIVLDCGTATTFDIVSPSGHYAGGLILPGVEISLSALSERAARLPEVSLERPRELIGRDTISSMQAGSYWGTIDALQGIITRLHGQPGYETAPVIATGGLAGQLLADLPHVSAHVPHLTLEGLCLLGEKHFFKAARQS